MFLYFDLGNVLLNFDNAIICRNVAQLTGLTEARVHELVFTSKLNRRYERGEIDSRGFYDEFVKTSGTKPEYPALLRAASDMFTLNTPVVPIVAQLRAAGQRIGILSNTSPAHWEFVSDGRYTLLPGYFEVFALSYQVKSLKPERSIYDAAANLAGTNPRDIFFVDDRPENVEGARAAGFDAVPFTTAVQLADDLRQRGVRFNF